MIPLSAQARGLAALGALSAALAVGAGAFGAHSLRDVVSAERLAMFETGARYHLIHSVGLFAVAWVADRRGGWLPVVAGGLMAVGIVLFSGSLYLLTLTGERLFGAITPFGGVCFIAAWLLTGLVLAVAVEPNTDRVSRSSVAAPAPTSKV